MTVRDIFNTTTARCCCWWFFFKLLNQIELRLFVLHPTKLSDFLKFSYGILVIHKQGSQMPQFIRDNSYFQTSVPANFTKTPQCASYSPTVIIIIIDVRERVGEKKPICFAFLKK